MCVKECKKQAKTGKKSVTGSVTRSFFWLHFRLHFFFRLCFWLLFLHVFYTFTHITPLIHSLHLSLSKTSHNTMFGFIVLCTFASLYLLLSTMPYSKKFSCAYCSTKFRWPCVPFFLPASSSFFPSPDPSTAIHPDQGQWICLHLFSSRPVD